MERPLARCVPKASYWLTAVFFVGPVAAVMITAVLVMPISKTLGHQPSPWFLRSAFVAVGALIVACVCWYDYRRLQYTLTEGALLPGRIDATRVPFDEIESIVLGLPARVTWWLRLLPRKHKVAFGERNVFDLRERTVLVRLRGDRVLPLCLAQKFMKGGTELMSEFVRLNAAKITSSDSYVPREIAALGHVKFNRIRAL